MPPSNRIGALRGLAVSALCGLGLACGGEAPVRPNLVLITVAPLPAEALACYGGPADAGAEICGLGDTGARYSWAFAPSPDIAPAGASMLTSLYPWRHGVTPSAASFLRDHIDTLPERLHRAGYATAAFVGAPGLNRSRNLVQGFDVYDDRAQDDPASRGRSASERALAWAGQAERPFFLWIHFELGSRAGDARDAQDAELRRLDRKLSQLIAVLDADPRKPGILLAGLQGAPASGLVDRRRGRDGHIHPLGVRVPLLWRPARAGPGHSVGRRITTPVSLVDVAPTLLAAAGLAARDDLAGQPLPYGDIRQADAEGEPDSRSIFIEHAEELAVVADGEWAVVARSSLGAPAASEDASPQPSAGPVASPAPVTGRTAGLWPTGDRRNERTPAYDGPRERAKRLERQRPRLERFAAQRRGATPETAPLPTPAATSAASAEPAPPSATATAAATATATVTAPESTARAED